jgi:hypothetical protein
VGIGDEPEAVEAEAVESRWSRFAEAIYGSIFVTGLVGALSEHNATARAAAVSVVSTTAVFWLAHVWAELLAERAATGKPGGWPRFLRLAWQEWPIVEAGALPFLALALAWAGVYANGVGFDAALARRGRPAARVGRGRRAPHPAALVEVRGGRCSRRRARARDHRPRGPDPLKGRAMHAGSSTLRGPMRSQPRCRCASNARAAATAQTAADRSLRHRRGQLHRHARRRRRVQHRCSVKCQDHPSGLAGFWPDKGAQYRSMMRTSERHLAR